MKVSFWIFGEKTCSFGVQNFFYLYLPHFHVFFESLKPMVERVLSGLIKFQKCSNALSPRPFKFQRQPNLF